MRKAILFTLLSVGLINLTGCSSEPSSTQTTVTSELPVVSDIPSNTEKINNDSTSPTANDLATNAQDTSKSSADQQETENLGAFQAIGLDGETITPSIFSDYDLTMVNVFATWCSPCLEEMPDLELISQDVKSQSVQIVGIALDVSSTPQIDPTMESVLKQVVDKTGVTYPILMPDETLSNFLADITAVPTTFFVDKNGDIVSGTYLGAKTQEQWRSIIQKEQAAIGQSS